jgi:hypothetical protein
MRMALNAINLPLAFTGQETIWQRVNKTLLSGLYFLLCQVKWPCRPPCRPPCSVRNMLGYHAIFQHRRPYFVIITNPYHHSLGISKVIGSKILSCGMVHQGISHRVFRGTTYDPGHWTFYFCRRGFGLVQVSIVVPLMLAGLPYARGRRFDSRSKLLFIVWTNLYFSSFITCSCLMLQKLG